MRIRLQFDMEVNPAVFYAIRRALKDPVRVLWFRHGLCEAVAMFLKRLGMEPLTRSLEVMGGSVRVVEDGEQTCPDSNS